MFSSQRCFKCLRCRLRPARSRIRQYHVSPVLSNKSNVTIAPKVNIDIKYIRANADAVRQNCLERNYKEQSTYPEKIAALYDDIYGYQTEALPIRRKTKDIEKAMKQKENQKQLVEIEKSKWATRATAQANTQGTSRHVVEPLRPHPLQVQARLVKEELSVVTAKIDAAMAEIEEMAAAIPNMTSKETPRGHDPTIVDTINEHPGTTDSSKKVWAHGEIGKELSILDFIGSARTSGWGWYFLLNEAAQLEQALIQYALKVAMDHGWSIVSPPTMVYGFIAAACGFQPRDQNGESQIYNIAQSDNDINRKPPMCLAGTAEIPLAGMRANLIVDESQLPTKVVGVSRAYRAEAGARGVDTKGLYRVHEFTKVEMFGWTEPNDEAVTALFDELLKIQTTILKSLDLHCRILEMPSTDLGASATRKRDIEAFFPSRVLKNDGFGEVTSASICTDYQTRRLSTRVKAKDGMLTYPFTVNGTAMAVPRVLAAILENGWDEERKEVRIPEVLWPWMGGVKVISKKEITSS